MFQLEDLGWNSFFQQQIDNVSSRQGIPARVAEEWKGGYSVLTERGAVPAILSGRLRYDATTRDAMPTAGDWVLAVITPDDRNAVIQHVFDRRTKLSRKTPGERTEEQVLAANVDTVFIVAALNLEFNPRRLERYLTAVWESGARPVILLSKADLCPDAGALLRDTESSAPGVPVYSTSAVSGLGIDGISPHIPEGETAVFVGASGVGKSSIINRLLKTAAQSVRDIRRDGKGRHTTTSRQLLILPQGGMVIDTPGLREFGLWQAVSGLDRAFADIDALAAECAFRDCKHVAEPGCAVLNAIDRGLLADDRVASYRKLERERRFIAGKQDESMRLATKKRWKVITKQHRQRERFRAKQGRF